MNVVCTIEARMGSTRLPGKMMKELYEGYTVLEAMVRRLRRCEYPDELVVATSTESGDDVIAETASDLGVECFRGSEEDVLERIVECGKEYDADVICETTGDCPLIDPNVVDQLIACFLDNERTEYASNVLTRSWPHGMDVEIVSMQTLKQIHEVADKDSYREHVTTYIRERTDEFNVFQLSPPPALRDPGIRVTLDYPADLKLIREVYDRLAEKGDPFAMDVGDVVDVFNREPELRNINQEHEAFSSDSSPK